MRIIYQPHPLLFEREKKKMNLTPVSEVGSAIEHEEEYNTGAEKIEGREDLKRENRELRSLCGYLDDAYHRNRQLALEWQSLGKYTAEILKEEIVSSQARDTVTQEQLARLTRENRELKEMCIFLEQSREGGAGGGAGGGEDNSLTPPEMLDTMLRGRVMGEVNRRQGSIPHYVGQTRRTRLKDTQAIKRGVASEASKELALDEMRARLDRVEVERVELIKSLSVAHVLAADANEADLLTGQGGSDGESSCSLAVMKKQWEDIRRLKEHKELPGDSFLEDRTGVASPVSSDVIMNAVTLLDIVKRLDAASSSGFADGVAEAEAVTLRLLVNIAWQKMQENINRMET